MFDLSRVYAAATVGESIAEFVRSTAEHLRGKSAVNWKPAIDEIEAAIPDVVAAIRSGTAVEDEEGSLAGDGDRGEAADAVRDATDQGEIDPAGYPGAEAEIERALEAAGDEGQAGEDPQNPSGSAGHVDQPEQA